MVTSQHDNAFRITIPLSVETTIPNGSTRKGQVIRSFEIYFGVRLSKLRSQQLSWGLVLRRRISRMRYFPIRKSKDYIYGIWVSMSYLFISISFNDTFISNTKFIWQWMDLINVSYFHYWSRVLWVSITKYQMFTITKPARVTTVSVYWNPINRLDPEGHVLWTLFSNLWTKLAHVHQEMIWNND